MINWIASACAIAGFLIIILGFAGCGNNTANQRSTATGSASPTAATTTASAEAASQPPRNVYFATVTANGALGPNRNGITSSSNIGGAAKPGEYLVIFTNPVHVNTCVLNTTMASNSSGEVTVQPGGANNRVHVYTFDSTGKPSDRAFSITAFCL